MNQDERKRLDSDPDGLLTYEYLANNAMAAADDDLAELIANLKRVDHNGQFTASAARFLHAVDAERFAGAVCGLVAATIDRDREHRYLPDLMTCLYGEDYERLAPQLRVTDDNFRRMYKRIHPSKSL